jgi:hypothetical protein
MTKASDEARQAWAMIDHERTNYEPVLEFAERLGVSLPKEEVVDRWLTTRVERVLLLKGSAIWKPRDPNDIFVAMLEAKLKEKNFD